MNEGTHEDLLRDIQAIYERDDSVLKKLKIDDKLIPN